MKKALFYILAALFFFSCHKNKSTPVPVTCDSYSIGLTTGTNVTIITTNTTTGQVVKNYENVIVVDNLYSKAFGVYDHIHSCYYLSGITNVTQPILYRLNTATGIGDTLGAPLADTVVTLNNLICNSTTGKLYFFGQDYYTLVSAIYEITPNATGFSQRLVCHIANSSWGNYISSPVIDENTGYIYCFLSTTGRSGSGYTLIKVDPVSGNSSFVANTDISPSGLIFNNNDGMFYGVNVYYVSITVNPPISTVSYISIDPSTGNITTILDSIDHGNDPITAFDYCNNLYVYGDGCLEPSTGKIVKYFSPWAIWNDAGIY